MHLPKSSTLSAYDDSGNDDQERRSKLRIIKVKKKKNVGEVDLSEIKRKKVNNWKTKKDELKKMMNLDLLMLSKDRKRTVYDQDRIVPREIHELHDNTDDELFLKIESGSVSTINTETSSTRDKFEKKFKNTKDKYMKYQAKAFNKIKSLMPTTTKSNENLKFMTASDISKSRTLVAENSGRLNCRSQISIKKPPRPPLPKNYHSNKGHLNLESFLKIPLTPDKPPIRPARKKSKKSLTSLNSTTTITTIKTSLPASVYYKQLRERWLEKNLSKSNLSSICSNSLLNCSENRKFSLTTNQSQMNDDFRYRFRADFHQSNQQLNFAAEKQSIKSEPTFTLGKLESFYICLFLLFLIYFLFNFKF